MVTLHIRISGHCENAFRSIMNVFWEIWVRCAPRKAKRGRVAPRETYRILCAISHLRHRLLGLRVYRIGPQVFRPRVPGRLTHDYRPSLPPRRLLSAICRGYSPTRNIAPLRRRRGHECPDPTPQSQRPRLSEFHPISHRDSLPLREA